MNIRKSNKYDLDSILKVYAIAREFMKLSGNPLQWGDTYPSKELVREDIEKGRSYVLEDGENICGCFVFFTGIETVYEKIGKKSGDKEYGIIHRVASDGRVQGIMNKIIKFATDKIDNIKIDTHNDNMKMQHILEKLKFKKCGIIYLEDKSERILYNYRRDYD